MATYYVALSGNFDGGNAGSDAAAGTIADPWLTSQKALDTAVAGDTVYWFGTQTLAALVDIDTNSGSIAVGLIKHIGSNSAGADDGTMAILNGDSAAVNCLKITATSFILMKNIELKNSTSTGLLWASAGSNFTFINVWAHNCGAHGFNMATFGAIKIWIRCRAYSNTTSGWNGSQGENFWGCVGYSNSVNGAAVSTVGSNYNSCVFYSNTTSGLNTLGAGAGTYLVQNCVINNCASGIIVSSTVMNLSMIGNRITNNATAGISMATGKIAFEDHNYINGNGTNISTAGTAIIIQGGNSTVGSGTDGYTDAGAGNFNMTSSATLRQQTISLDGTNISYLSAGLPALIVAILASSKAWLWKQIYFYYR